MPWKIELSPDKKIIETLYAGILTPSDLSDAVIGTWEYSRLNNIYNLLSDCTRLEGGHSVVDLYGLIDLLADMPKIYKIREAILVPQLPDSLENVRFWETACYNRGVTVKLFTDRQEAVDWLKRS
jgi:hypothetical protein